MLFILFNVMQILQIHEPALKTGQSQYSSYIKMNLKKKIYSKHNLILRLCALNKTTGVEIILRREWYIYH